MTKLNNVLIHMLYNVGMYITGVCTVTSITISPAVVVEGDEFSIQCTYDVPLFHLAIKRAASDTLSRSIKAAEYLHVTGYVAVLRTLRDRATFFTSNTTLVIRNAISSMDAASYQCEVTSAVDAVVHYSDLLSLHVYGKNFLYSHFICQIKAEFRLANFINGGAEWITHVNH